MTATAARAPNQRFRISACAEALRPAAHGVYGYRWPHPSPRASLVLLHGLQSHAGWFAEAAEGLVQRGFAVYALDRRGSGCSPAARGDVTSRSEWLDEVAAVVQQAEADYPDVPTHLVGHCFGANIALASLLTLRLPARSLVILAPGLALRAEYSLWTRIRIGVCALLRPQARFPVPLRDERFTRDPEVLDWIRQDPLAVRYVTARCLLQIRNLNRGIRRRLPTLHVPVLVLEAQRDRISDNPRNRAALQRALGDRCEFRSFDAEHFLLAEPCCEAVLDALAEWVTLLEDPPW